MGEPENVSEQPAAGLPADIPFDPDNPPYSGWAGWLGGVAELRRYHEVPRWRTIWRQVEAPGLPAEMLSIDV